MSEASFASLEPALLARKGGAKPAMRPQLAPLPDAAPDAAQPGQPISDDRLEDLGWNDMGEDDPANSTDTADDYVIENRQDGEAHAAARASNIVSLPRPAANPDPANEAHDDSHATSPVMQRRERGANPPALAGAAMPLRHEAETDTQDGPLARRKPARHAESKSARRTAFTLRLDPERHLKLRLAATMHDISAQALVTQALDQVFAGIEDLDALTARLRPN